MKIKIIKIHLRLFDLSSCSIPCLCNISKYCWGVVWRSITIVIFITVEPFIVVVYAIFSEAIVNPVSKVDHKLSELWQLCSTSSALIFDLSKVWKIPFLQFLVFHSKRLPLSQDQFLSSNSQWLFWNRYNLTQHLVHQSLQKQALKILIHFLSDFIRWFFKEKYSHLRHHQEPKKLQLLFFLSDANNKN